jgi:predicted TIM-barrel fold metal-dependent hydrolase
MMFCTRRQFLCRSASAAAWLAAASGRSGVAQPAPPTLPIIDTHQHLWDLTRVRLSWLPDAPHLNRSFLPSDYAEAAKGLGIVKTVYMEVDTAEQSKQAEADYVLDLCRRGETPTVAAVIGGDPAAENFRAYILQFKDSPYLKGVRQIVRDRQWFADAKFRRGIQFLGERGLSFDLCHGPDWLGDAAGLVDACPATRFILDHCGNANVKTFLPPAKDEPAAGAAARRRQVDQWRRGMAALARRKNVVCKISGIIASAPKGCWTPEQLAPIVHHCLEVFGPDRVMFAGDWPVCTAVATLRQWVGALRQIVTDPVQQRKLFHDNAARFYRLG